MTTLTMTFSEFTLPWDSSLQEDARFKRILKHSMLLFLLFSAVIPWLPLPEINREKAEAIPPILAKVIIHQKIPAPLREP
ncbi:MAG: energy transducer TonB, partial [Candidatus Thiodiazotropha sp.]